MRVVPKKQAELTGFYATHVAPWRENASAIGLSEAMVAMLEQRVATARAAAVARDRARAAAEAATQTHQDALDALGRLGAGMMAAIRLKAQSIDDSGVYQLAKIPAPQKASPLPAPGKAVRPVFTLQQTGTLELAWSCKNPQGSAGTMYEVARQRDGGDWESLGVTGKKVFADQTIPPGTVRIIYRVRALRCNRSGEAALFLIRLSGAGMGAAVRRAA